ncbi:lipoprotein [Mesorhizobium sp. LHD-90]|uniref:lipoprotein n=1 Tax=Mesorhizobium sp. LHD-90 TaxID=3071414 RepID=UPI0027E19D1A|nr:lipoprotein [Mesorhizobium sp. LHD-90]MDQ6433578.1 lipoprotein [Mesorhizobium sp. LHD-90]
MRMRRLLLTTLTLVLLAGCQNSGTRGIDPAECDPRATDSGRCVPGELPPEE